MIQQTLVTAWFLLSSFLSICFSSTPPLSTIHKFNIMERQRDTGQEVDVALLSTLYYLKRSKRDERGGLYLLQTSHSLPGPYSAVSRKKDVKENTDSMRTTNPLTINASSAVLTTMTALTTITTTTTTTITTTTITAASVITNTTTSYPILLSSSCFSPACKWLVSWHFIAVVSVTVTWLVMLMILYVLTRTARGEHFLEACSSLCTCDKKNQEEEKVLAKGIGYFDGSPGMRRFILIEDDDDDEEEEEEEDMKEENNTEGREEDRTLQKWKPPRKGTYILQEASKKDVLEIGTYRLQEEEEEEEVNGKITRKKEGNEDEIEYILDGEAYLLQSESVERQGIEGRREGYEPIGGIEGLYGIVGRGGMGPGGYRMIKRLEKVYGVVGRRGVGVSRYGRTAEIERFSEVLKGEGTERVENKKVGREKGSEEDGVLMSVMELEGAVGGNTGEEECTGGGRDSDNWREEREDIYLELEGGSGSVEMNRVAAKGWRERGKIGMEQRGRERAFRETWEGRRRGSRGNFIKAEREIWGGLSPLPPQRAASFPMDHFLASQFLTRRLSLIKEEETH